MFIETINKPRRYRLCLYTLNICVHFITFLYNSATPLPADQMGLGIINNPTFAEFDRWYSGSISIPVIALTDDTYLHYPGILMYTY